MPATKATGEPEDASVGFVLTDLTRRYTRRFEHNARDFELNLTQSRILTALSRREGMMQAQFAELLDVDPMMIVRVVDRFESMGLVERRSDPRDRRSRSLHLCDKAKPYLAKIKVISEFTRAEVFSVITREEEKTLLNVIARLRQHLNRLEDDSSLKQAEISLAPE